MPTLLLMPAVVVVSRALMTPLDVECDGTRSSLLALPALFLVFFVAAFCEEAAPYLWTVLTALAAVVVTRLGGPRAQNRLGRENRSSR